MNSLYQAPPIQEKLGRCLRPGGTQLTTYLLDLLKVQSGRVVLDSGCGKGATLEVIKSYTDHVIGMDIDEHFTNQSLEKAFPVVQGDMNNLPFGDGTVDFIISECAWNLTNRERSVAEFHRVLSDGGKLGIVDIFLREPKNNLTWPVHSCFNGATSLDSTVELFKQQGFMVLSLEDHSRILTSLAAEFVFYHGSLHDFWQQITGEKIKASQACECGRRTRPGLFLLVVQKQSASREVNQ